MVGVLTEEGRSSTWPLIYKVVGQSVSQSVSHNLVFRQQPERTVVVDELTEKRRISSGPFIYKMVLSLHDSVSQSASQSFSQS